MCQDIWTLATYRSCEVLFFTLLCHIKVRTPAGFISHSRWLLTQMNVTLTNILQWARYHVFWSLTLILNLVSTVTMNNSMLSLSLLTALQEFEDICHISTKMFYFFLGKPLCFPHLFLSLFYLYVIQYFHWFSVWVYLHHTLSFSSNPLSKCDTQNSVWS